MFLPKGSPVRKQWALTLIAGLFFCGVVEAASTRDVPDDAVAGGHGGHMRLLCAG